VVDPKELSDKELIEISKKSKEKYLEFYRLMKERADELLVGLLGECLITKDDSIDVLTESALFISRISYLPIKITQHLKQGNLYDAGLNYVDYFRESIFERMKAISEDIDSDEEKNNEMQ
jgi:hypothetical protein